MEHLGKKIIISPVIILAFMLLLSFNNAAAEEYTGTCREFFETTYLEYYAGLYGIDSSQLLAYYDECAEECTDVVFADLNGVLYIYFLPDSFNYFYRDDSNQGCFNTSEPVSYWYQMALSPSLYYVGMMETSLLSSSIGSYNYVYQYTGQSNLYGTWFNTFPHSNRAWYYLCAAYPDSYPMPEVYSNVDLWCTTPERHANLIKEPIYTHDIVKIGATNYLQYTIDKSFEDFWSNNAFWINKDETSGTYVSDGNTHAWSGSEAVVDASGEEYVYIKIPLGSEAITITSSSLSLSTLAGISVHTYTSTVSSTGSNSQTGMDETYEGTSSETGISSSDITAKYNLVSIDGDDLSILPSWTKIGYIIPSTSEIDYSFAGLDYQPAGDDLILHMPYLNIAAIGKELSVDQFALYFYYDALNAYSSSYDVIIFPLMSVSGSDTYISGLQIFVTERFYKRQVCNNLTDGFTMMGDYLYDLSEQNNALYSLLYSDYTNSYLALSALNASSKSQVECLNNILTGINNLAPLQSWEPYDDTDVLQWMSDTYSLLEAQEFGTKLDSIINALNGTLKFDSTDILAKLDEVITAIENIEVNISQTVIQEEEEGIFDFVLDILKELITAVIKVATKLLGFVIDVIGTFIGDILDLFDYLSWIFTDAVSLDNNYMLIFEAEEGESKDLIDGAFVYLSLFSVMLTSLPEEVLMLILLSFVLTGLFVVMRRF